MQKMAARTFADLVRMADALATRKQLTAIPRSIRPPRMHDRRSRNRGTRSHQEIAARRVHPAIASWTGGRHGSERIAQWAHDIRNTLATAALYLESLERPVRPIRSGY